MHMHSYELKRVKLTGMVLVLGSGNAFSAFVEIFSLDFSQIPWNFRLQTCTVYTFLKYCSWHAHTEYLGQTWLQFSLVTVLWQWDSVKSFKQPLHFQSPSKLARMLQNYFCFSAQGQCVTHIHFFSPLMCPFLTSSPACSLDFPFLFLRPDVALHQPGHPHLHRMFGDPQGAGSPLLQDPVSHSGRTQHLRALGKSPLGLLAESPHVPCFYFFVTVWFIPFHWFFFCRNLFGGF